MIINATSDPLSRIMFAANLTSFIVNLAVGIDQVSIFLVHSDDYA